MDTRKIEKVVRGFANHRRIQVLALLEEKPSLSVFDISDELHVNFKTISMHLSRLATAKLIDKRNRGSRVEHRLSELGRKVLKFSRTLE